MTQDLKPIKDIGSLQQAINGEMIEVLFKLVSFVRTRNPEFYKEFKNFIDGGDKN